LSVPLPVLAPPPHAVISTARETAVAFKANDFFMAHHPFWIVGLFTRMPVSRSFVTLIIRMVWKIAVMPVLSSAKFTLCANCGGGGHGGLKEHVLPVSSGNGE
jgi:hypothetical protein